VYEKLKFKPGPNLNSFFLLFNVLTRDLVQRTQTFERWHKVTVQIYMTFPRFLKIVLDFSKSGNHFFFQFFCDCLFLYLDVGCVEVSK